MSRRYLFISSVSVFSCWMKRYFIYRRCVVTSCFHYVYSGCEIFGYYMFFIIYVEVYFLKVGFTYIYSFMNAAHCSPLRFRKYTSKGAHTRTSLSQAQIYFTTHAWVDTQTLLVHFSIQNEFIEASCSSSDNTRWMRCVREKNKE